MFLPHADLKPLLIDLEVDNNTTGGKQDIQSVQPERLSEGDNMYCVYWLHLPEHKSYNEGYIGITKNFKIRLIEHKSNKRITHLTNAIKKYKWNNIIKEILHKNLTLDKALILEREYRPFQKIGWNSKQGGNLGVEKEWYYDLENKEKHSKNTSIKTKEGILNKDSYEKRSFRAKQNWSKNRNSYNRQGSKNSRSILNEEQVKCIKCELLKKGIKDYIIAKQYNVKPYVINFIRKEKNWKHVMCDSPGYE